MVTMNSEKRVCAQCGRPAKIKKGAVRPIVTQMCKCGYINAYYFEPNWFLNLLQSIGLYRKQGVYEVIVSEMESMDLNSFIEYYLRQHRHLDDLYTDSATRNKVKRELDLYIGNYTPTLEELIEYLNKKYASPNEHLFIINVINDSDSERSLDEAKRNPGEKAE